MSMKIIAAAIIGLMLVVLPIGYVQNVEATQVPYDGGGLNLGTDPMAMLGQLWEFITKQGPQLVGQIFQIVMAVVLSIVAFLQTGLAVLLNPQGIPLLFAMTINGINYAFSYGITFAIYGSIIGLFVPPLIGLVFWAPVGLTIGVIFGFSYGFVYGSEYEKPGAFVNPFTKPGWEEAIFPS